MTQADATTPTNEITPNFLRRVNERRILEAIQNKGSLSRAGLVRQTGISPPTVSKLVRSLIAARLLEEGDVLAPAPGRPARILHLAHAGVRVLGLVLEAQECSIAATGLEGRLTEAQTIRFPTPDTYEQLLDAVVKHVRRLTPRGKKAGTLGLGASVPALIDRRQQQVVLASKIPILDGHFLAGDLQKRLDVPAILFHNTDALCLGERAFGQARGVDDFVFINATSGLGASVMNDGRLISGHHGRAGEFGHITVDIAGRRCACGNIGCLETLATDAALARRISETLGRTLDIEQVIELARAEPSAASADAMSRIDAEIQRAVEYLAIAVAAAINIFNPEAVFVRSRMFEVREGLFETLLELVRTRALKPLVAECKILRSTQSKLQGAIAGTIQHLTSVLGPKM